MNINSILEYDYKNRKDKKYIFEKTDGVFQGRTFGQLISDVHSLARLLLKKLPAGSAVGIIGKNSYALMVADLAVTGYTGVSVMLAKEMSEDVILSMLERTNAKAIIYDDDLSKTAERLNKRRPMFCLSMSCLYSLSPPPALFDLPVKDEAECCKIVFSSGTTGPSKGIKLTQKVIFAGYHELIKRVPLGENDTDYLFLPLHHTYAGVYNFYYSLVGGYSIYLSSSPSKIAEELREVNPTIFCAVPLVYKRLLNVFGDRITSAFGTNIKYLFTGGAPCPDEIRAALSSFPLIRSYGLSETAASFAISYLGDDDASCGTVFDSIDAKVFRPDENGIGEIICKGDTVFPGYLDPELTAAAFDENGYFHTGDLGMIKDGKLYIKGRKKKILVGDNGKNIDVETLCALLRSLSGNTTEVRLYLNNNRLNADLYVKNTEEDISEAVERFNGQVMRHEQIDSFRVISDAAASRLK